MTETYKRILAAVDGSVEAELAAKKAINVALRNDAELLLAYVIDEQSYQGEGVLSDYVSTEQHQEAKALLEKFVVLAKEKGVQQVREVIEVGSPKVLLAKDIPAQEQVDLIMVGATGLNTFERLFIGSTSEYIMRHTEVDLLVVRNSEKTL